MELNAEQIYKNKIIQEERLNKEYIKILRKCEKCIKRAARNRNYCVFEIPTHILSVAGYSKDDCLIFILYQLRKNKYIVEYIPPKYIQITWRIPDFDPKRVENCIVKKKKEISIFDKHNYTNTNKNTNSNNNKNTNKNKDKDKNKPKERKFIRELRKKTKEINLDTDLDSD